MSPLQRFAILQHDYPFLHWDLMLQVGNTLKTWRLLSRPTHGEWIAAESLPEHRLEYLDYEGPVSGNRGSVHRIADGNFALVSNTPSNSSEEASAAEYALQDCDLASRAVLRESTAGHPEWRFE